jgi:protoporphyrinogen oxidase
VNKEQKILIIGAGPAGLGAAWRLHELGHTQWRLLEAADWPGGLAGSVVDDQGFTWDMGGHIVFSHYDYFDRLLDVLLGDAWVPHVRESWIWMRDRFIPYPMQHNVWRLPPEDLLRCLDGLVEVHSSSHKSLPPKNFREWILWNFGDGLAEVFFVPYNRKVWTLDPSELNVEWVDQRVATVDLKSVLRNFKGFIGQDCGEGPKGGLQLEPQS